MKTVYILNRDLTLGHQEVQMKAIRRLISGGIK